MDPSGTAQWEKRNISDAVPRASGASASSAANWCDGVVHGLYRARHHDESALFLVPRGLCTRHLLVRGFPNLLVHAAGVRRRSAPGRELCVEACPARSLEMPGARAGSNMEAKAPRLERERRNLDSFNASRREHAGGPGCDARRAACRTLRLLSEDSGACGGCGETLYLRLLTEPSAHRLLVANATRRSSIYGGNLPMTPWAKTATCPCPRGRFCSRTTPNPASDTVSDPLQVRRACVRAAEGAGATTLAPLRVTEILEAVQVT